MRKYFHNAQWLRFACAFYLVLYHSVPAAQVHATGIMQQLTLGMFNLGFFATSIFFTLSGFLMANAYANYDGSSARVANPMRFLLNRLAVIYPIHIVALILYAVVAVYSGKLLLANFGGLDQFLGREPWIRETLGQSTFLLSLGMSVTLTQAWNPFFLNLNGASWSLSALLFFYLLFPVLTPKLLRPRRKLALLFALMAVYSLPALLLAFADVDSQVWVGLLHRNPLFRLPEFMAGILLFGICHDRRTLASTPRPRFGMIGIAIAIVLGAMLLTAYVTSNGPGYVWYLLHNGALLPVALLTVFIATHSASLPLTKFGDRLGAASLCIFALHAPIGSIFKVIVASGAATAAANCPTKSSACAAGLSQFEALGVLVLYLIAVVVVAFLVQEKFVVPTSRWLRDRIGRKLPLDDSWVSMKPVVRHSDSGASPGSAATPQTIA